MAADAAISLGVLIGAAAIMATGWLWLDPAISIVIALVITAGLRESLHRFGIAHCTVQVETGPGGECAPAPRRPSTAEIAQAGM